MTPTQKAKRDIRAYVRMHFSDQKLAEVIAFNQDGFMSCMDACACIRGVTLSDTLHCYPAECSQNHYQQTLSLQGAAQAEQAYYQLGHEENSRIGAAQRLMSAILRGEQRRRQWVYSLAPEYDAVWAAAHKLEYAQKTEA